MRREKDYELLKQEVDELKIEVKNLQDLFNKNCLALYEHIKLDIDYMRNNSYISIPKPEYVDPIATAAHIDPDAAWKLKKMGSKGF